MVIQEKNQMSWYPSRMGVETFLITIKSEKNMIPKPNIIWDKGSAYDLFVSLWILHRPDEFGLRPSWAAGVRSRLPIPLRDVLEESQKFINVPLAFIHDLPEPKDAAAVLEAFKTLPPEERLPALVFGSKSDERTKEYKAFLMSLQGKQRLTANVEARIKEGYRPSSRATKSILRALFEAWSNRKNFGENLYQALEAYVENFYREEEIRIIPAQAQALENVQSLAAEKDVLAVVEELSAGVRLDLLADTKNLIMAPSFWGAPFVFFDRLEPETSLILFGARPKGMALVPGDLVPEDLLNALKALADPTRLRILRYLLEGPGTPSELSRILRLRPPTVIHHLNQLRLAGLVRLTVSPETERRYEVRMDGVDKSIQNLNLFLSGD
jgi:DNA-binding transcriptional ArsR family regulator